MLPDGAGPRVVNNTFVANRVAIRLYRAVSIATQVYRNNLLFGNTTGVLVDFGTDVDNPTWQNNLVFGNGTNYSGCLLYTSPSPRDRTRSRMPSSA